MSFHFNTGVCPTKSQELHAAYIDVCLAAENLHQLKTELTDHCESFDTITGLITNVDKSLEMLSQFGNQAIPHLNIDKGLESLMKMPAELITAEKAIEALEGQQKSLLQKVIDWVKTFFEKAKRFVENLFAMNNGDATKVGNAKEMINIDDEVSMVPHPRAVRLIELHRDAMKVYDDVLTKWMIAGEKGDIAGELQELFELANSKMTELAKTYNAVTDFDEGTGVLKLKSNEFMRENTTVKRAGYADIAVAKVLAKTWLENVPRRTFDHWGVEKWEKKMNGYITSIQNRPHMLTYNGAANDPKLTKDALRDTDEARRFRIQTMKMEMMLIRLMVVIQSQIAHSLHVLAKHCQ